MNTRTNKAAELDAEIKRLAAACSLDSWTSFVSEMLVPGDIYPALASGRPELIKLIPARDLKADEAKMLFNIIGDLIATNYALREHAQQVAQFTDDWAGAFKALQSVGYRIQRFANFEHDDGEEDEG